MSILPKLRELITHKSQISVAEYMELCNTHYYATRDPFGTQGDFTTAPEISQIFGELIGAWLAQTWHQLGSPKAVMCEAGGGRGTLMKDVLRATRNLPQFHDAIRVVMVETSPVLEALQRKALGASSEERGSNRLSSLAPRTLAPIEWHPNLNNLPSLPLLLVANEFLDALPIEQEVHTKEGWQQRHILMRDNTLSFSPVGDRIRESSPACLAVMKQICDHIKRFGGAALFIDYGYNTAAEGDTLQALKNHKFHNPLETPGEADLTAHVNFGALQQAAIAMKLHGYYTTQGEFLRRLGAELRATALCKNTNHESRATILQGLERLVSPEQMGELFKVLCVTSLMDDVAGF